MGPHVSMTSHRNLIVLPVLLLSCLVGAAVASASASHSSLPAPAHHKKKKPNSGGALASMGAQPSPSIFGIDTATFDSSASNMSKDIPTARQLDARGDHFTLGASSATGNYKIVDSEVKQARKRHMGVVISLGGIASDCSVRPMPASVHTCPPTTAKDLSTYKAYVQRVLLHYRNVVQYFESWTEPNYKASWVPAPSALQYAAVLTAQYADVLYVNRKYKRHIKLLFGSPVDFSIGPSASGWIAVLPFTEQVLDALHGSRPFNGIALHAYRVPPGPEGPSAQADDYVGGIPSSPGAKGPFPSQGCSSSPWCTMTWPQELLAYEQEFANHGYGQEPMWLTEFGWPGNAQANGPDFPSAATQADYVRQAYDDLLGLSFVQGAFWFNLRDYQPVYLSGDPAYFYHFGLLNYRFSQKPAASTFQALAKANPER